MTSQLNVDTIVDKAGSGGTNVKIGNTSTYVSEGGAVTQNTAQGMAKNWTNHNNASTVYDSFNQASTTDVGTGIQRSTFTNAMGNANYSYTALSSRSSSAYQVGLFCGNSSDSSAPTSSAAQVNELASSSSFFDVDLISNTFHGDLA